MRTGAFTKSQAWRTAVAINWEIYCLRGYRAALKALLMPPDWEPIAEIIDAAISDRKQVQVELHAEKLQ